TASSLRAISSTTSTPSAPLRSRNISVRRAWSGSTKLHASLRNHQLRGLDHPRKRACLTAVANLFLTRPDSTTAAERFSGRNPGECLRQSYTTSLAYLCILLQGTVGSVRMPLQVAQLFVGFGISSC